MKKLWVLCLCSLLLCGVCSQAGAEPKITANALFNGRAVLLVDNEPVFFANGETHKGITLINANENRAVIRLNGEQRELYLDKGVAEKYARAEGVKQELDA